MTIVFFFSACCFNLGNLTKRLAIELLQQVRNPHSGQRPDGVLEAEDELAVAGVPQRIASKRTKSELLGLWFLFLFLTQQVHNYFCLLTKNLQKTTTLWTLSALVTRVTEDRTMLLLLGWTEMPHPKNCTGDLV